MQKKHLKGAILPEHWVSQFLLKQTTMGELKIHVREAVRCHFDDEDLPKIVQLHFVKDEIKARLKYGH